MPTYFSLPYRIFTSSKYKVALSLPDLQAQTNSFSKKYAPGCSASLLDSDPPNLYLHYNVTCSAKWSDPKGHEVRVKFDLSQVTDENTAKDIDVRVSCSCPAFLYWGAQWNLNQRDSLEGQARPLLAPPTERLDLRGDYVICKHCWVVFKRILPSVQHNIVKILRKREVERKKPTIEQKPEVKKRQDEMKEREERRKTKGKPPAGTPERRQNEQVIRDQRMLPEHYKIVRTEPATHVHPIPNEPDIHDPELEKLDQQVKEEEEAKLRMQEEEEAKMMTPDEDEESETEANQ